jgi:hypothetical protein
MLISTLLNKQGPISYFCPELDKIFLLNEIVSIQECFNNNLEIITFLKNTENPVVYSFSGS